MYEYHFRNHAEIEKKQIGKMIQRQVDHLFSKLD